MLIISGAYVFAIIIACDAPEKMHLSPHNPAIAAAIVFSNITTGAFKANYSFVQCTFSYIGAILATVLYEFVYKKSIDIIDIDQLDDFGSMDSDKYHDNAPLHNAYMDEINGDDKEN
jgi:glycerol uptake facilitator-like aquaporin